MLRKPHLVERLTKICAVATAPLLLLTLLAACTSDPADSLTIDLDFRDAGAADAHGWEPGFEGRTELFYTRLRAELVPR